LQKLPYDNIHGQCSVLPPVIGLHDTQIGPPICACTLSKINICPCFEKKKLEMTKNYDPFWVNVWLNPFLANIHSIQVHIEFLKSSQMDMAVNF
jgi:hypothetical protein